MTRLLVVLDKWQGNRVKVEAGSVVDEMAQDNPPELAADDRGNGIEGGVELIIRHLPNETPGCALMR